MISIRNVAPELKEGWSKRRNTVDIDLQIRRRRQCVLMLIPAACIILAEMMGISVISRAGLIATALYGILAVFCVFGFVIFTLELAIFRRHIKLLAKEIGEDQLVAGADPRHARDSKLVEYACATVLYQNLGQPSRWAAARVELERAYDVFALFGVVPTPVVNAKGATLRTLQPYFHAAEEQLRNENPN